jgi:hypothetical protein
MTAPWSPPPDAIRWDCPDCGAGLWLTELEAAEGCPVDHPELCGAALVKRAGVVRCCRLDVDECARRCTSKPGGCDTYGKGLEADGLGCSVAGRRTVVGEDGRVSVELDLAPALDTT